MALPLDTSGAALTNMVVDEVHAVSTLEQRYIIPNKGTFFVNKLKVANDSNGQLLEPVIDYMVLQLSIDASNETLKEASQIIYIKNPEVVKVRLNYQAVGSARYEDIHTRVRAYISDFINGKISNQIFNAVAGETMELLPRDFLSTPHEQNTGAMIYTQLSNIAEAVATGDPSAVQATYEFLINYTNNERGKYTSRLTEIRNKIDSIFKSTELVNGQYLFTHEDLNPFVYLNYGNWVSNPKMLFWGGPEVNPIFGEMKNISNTPGLLGIKTMAYRRDDNAPSIVYTLTANKTQVNEGESVVFTLTAPGVAGGTRLNYVLSGVKTTDVEGGSLSGAFVLNASSTASVTVTLVEDQTTDGDTNLVLRLVSAPDIFAFVKVNDTSQEIKYEAYFSSDEAGTRVVQSADEGSSAYLQIRTMGLITDRTLFLLYNDSTVNDDDMLPRPTNVVVSNNRATVPYYFKNDFVTEGNETLTVNLCNTQNINSRVVRTTLQVNDTSKTPTLISFFTNASGSNDAIVNINEGLQLFLKIKTTNMPDGSVVNLTYSGTADAGDFLTALPASVSLLNNEAVVQFGVRADGGTEGDELFTVTSALDVNSSIKDVKSVTINDTSVGYMLDTAYFSNNSEGTQSISGTAIPSNVYLCIKTRGFNNGDKLRVEFNSSDTNVKDILTSLTADVTINNNYGYVYVALNDTRGTYTAIGQLRANIKTLVNNVVGNQIGPVINFTVNPRAVPTAKLTAVDGNNAAITQVNEGVTFRIKIETTNVPNGLEALPVTYSGTANANDFTTNLPTSVVITNGVGWLEYTTKADSTLEGTETFMVTLKLPYNGGTSSVQVNILDTSLPVVNVRWTSDNVGNNTITSINEGQTGYFQLRTSGFADGTVLQLGFSGQTNSADFTSMPNTATIVGGSAVVPYTFVNDYVQEGNEIFTISVNYQGTSLGASASILVNDTSLPGPVNVKWSRSATPTDASGNLVFNEGETVYLHIETKNVPVGGELIMSYNGTASSEDFSEGLPSRISVTGTWTTKSLTILSDMVEEAGANENLWATANYTSVSASTPSSISIVDTSAYTLVKDGGTTEVTLLPGARYLMILIGGGGSGGRKLTYHTTIGLAGNGSDGTTTAAKFLNSANQEMLNIYAMGGAGGRGTGPQWYPFNNMPAYSSILPSGGYVSVVPTDVSGGNGIVFDDTESYQLIGMDGGSQRYNFRYGLLDKSCFAGSNKYRKFNLPVSAITSKIQELYGNGSDGGGDITTDLCPAMGGASGGTYIGLVTNPTTTPIKVRLASGKGGVTNSNDGGLGITPPAAQAGVAFITRVASNYSVKANNPAASTLVATPYTESQFYSYNGDNYPGNKLIIPVGKRLRATISAAYRQMEADDYAGTFGLWVLKAENKTFRPGGMNDYDGVAIWFAIYKYSRELGCAFDQGSIFQKYGKQIKVQPSFFGLNNLNAFEPYTQGFGIPQEIFNVLPYYGDTNYRIIGGGAPANGSVVHKQNARFTTNDNTGKGYLIPGTNVIGAGAPRAQVVLENTSGYPMIVAPTNLSVGVNKINVFMDYVLEDI